MRAFSFEDREPAFRWWHGKSSFLNPEVNRAVGLELLSSVDLPVSSVTNSKQTGMLYHPSVDTSDQVVLGFVVLVVVSETVSIGAGVFADVEPAQRWFEGQDGDLAGFPGFVLPLLEPGL
jgi:hypothetical protein